MTRPAQRTPPRDIVIIGLSISSSWGNGHATTYRALVRELAAAGHHVTFLERDVEWYRSNRDEPAPAGCALGLYDSRAELEDRYGDLVQRADAVIVGSYVPEGDAVGRWVTRVARGVTAFYDIDTPVTLAKLARGELDYLSCELIPRFDLYLSFTGGPVLEALEREHGAQRARALYCSVDPERYRPIDVSQVFALGYLGTYSEDRQPTVERLLLEPARRRPRERFVAAGPCYPASVAWPRNVERIVHLPPVDHAAFYSAQAFTLNVTRADMRRAGWSPSVRLFEAAACGTVIISDVWDGLGELFTPGEEILLARDTVNVLEILSSVDEEERATIGARARQRVLNEHTAAHRAAQLLAYLEECRGVAKVSAPLATGSDG